MRIPRQGRGKSVVPIGAAQNHCRFQCNRESLGGRRSKDDLDGEAAAGTVAKMDRAAMSLADFLHNAQAETAALGVAAAENAIEAPKDLVTLGSRITRS